MELEKFNKAKELKEKIDRLERKHHKLSSAKKSCNCGASVEFLVFGISRQDTVQLSNTDNIREMIEREIVDVSVEIEKLKIEFEGI